MRKKIHIIGSSGSGKSYIARRLSKELGIKHYELDEIKYSLSPETGKILLVLVLLELRWVMNHMMTIL